MDSFTESPRRLEIMVVPRDELAAGLRELLAPHGVDGVSIKVVEVPPGPPVLSTLVAEVYGDQVTDYATQKRAAGELMNRLSREAHVVEIDSTIEADKPRLRFVTDRQKACVFLLSVFFLQGPKVAEALAEEVAR